MAVIESTVHPAADEEVLASRRAPRWTLLLTGALAGVVGVVLIVVATTVLDQVTAEIRVPLGLVGLAGVYMAVDRFGRAFRGPTFETGLYLSVAWLVLVLLAAVLADLLPLAESQDVSKTLREPILLRPDLFSEHPLGTDRQGLDILGGLVYGARVSLSVGAGAVLIGMLVGGTVGMLAGFYRGKLDALIGFVANAMLAFPPLILLLAMSAALEPSIRNVTLALAFISVPVYIRLARANTLAFAQREFVLAAKGVGASNRGIILSDLLPNVLRPVMSFGFVIVAVLIVAEASLSFLGLSIQRPDPTWGNLIAAGERDFETNPHLVFAPAMALFLTVFAMNKVGDFFRGRWDSSEVKV